MEAVEAMEQDSSRNIDGTREFSTGAVRSSDTDGVAYHLISPIALRRLAQVYRFGDNKYGATRPDGKGSPFNWEKGMPVDELLNHAIAHIYRFLEGHREDADSGEDYPTVELAHAAWNVMAAIHSFERWPELNQNLRGPGCTRPLAAE